MLSFERFQLSRVFVDDLSRFRVVDDDERVPGVLYMNETAYLYRKPGHTAESEYYVVLGNSEYESDDLCELERRLFEWYVNEYYEVCDATKVDGKPLHLLARDAHDSAHAATKLAHSAEETYGEDGADDEWRVCQPICELAMDLSVACGVNIDAWTRFFCNAGAKATELEVHEMYAELHDVVKGGAIPQPNMHCAGIMLQSFKHRHALAKRNSEEIAAHANEVANETTKKLQQIVDDTRALSAADDDETVELRLCQECAHDMTSSTSDVCERCGTNQVTAEGKPIEERL